MSILSIGVGTGKLLNATAGVLDIFGSHSDNCSVIGIPVGFTISSESGKEPISGGFVGYADLGRMSNCNVENIKKVASDQIAGGFVGKTSFEYLANPFLTIRRFSSTRGTISAIVPKATISK